MLCSSDSRGIRNWRARKFSISEIGKRSTNNGWLRTYIWAIQAAPYWEQHANFESCFLLYFLNLVFLTQISWLTTWVTGLLDSCKPWLHLCICEPMLSFDSELNLLSLNSQARTSVPYTHFGCACVWTVGSLLAFVCDCFLFTTKLMLLCSSTGDSSEAHD